MASFSTRSLRLVVFLLLASASHGQPTSGVTSSSLLVKTIVTVNPKNATIPINGTREFTAALSGGTCSAVAWSLIPPTGATSSSIGTINSRGKYTAPANLLPVSAALTVKATCVSNPTVTGTASVVVRNQIPSLLSVTPNQIQFGSAFTLTIAGSRFINGARVLWNSSPIATTFVSATRLTATGTASSAGKINITVANPGPDAVSVPLTVTVASGIAINVTPTVATVQAGATQQFTATVTGSGNQSATWEVNGLTGGDSVVGTISPTGLYTAPCAIPPAGIVTITAISQADNSTKATATVTIRDPLAVSYGRFLDQTTFGPTPLTMAHAREIGMQAYLDEQFETPESPWPSPSATERSGVVDAFFANAFNGQDQLRQRVIFALSEILVISMNKNTNGNELVPWLQLLSRNAFGNYRTLLKELTLDASMGKFLDLVNSGVGSGAPNENYPRELMQLFSIGLSKLNQDGSQQLDGNGNPVPTYTQEDVLQLAKALTGWTYNSANNTTRSGGNYNYYPGPMIPVPGKHNPSAKTFLGQTLPAGQTIQQDLDAAIDTIFNHSNVGPFISTRLIRALVTSNPSPAYISRIAAVFNDNGQGVRGDLKAVVRAIIMDQEARNDAPPENFGRLRTPMQHTIAFCRALKLDPGPASQFAYLFTGMNEGMLNAPSVFGHYSPLFRIPKSGGLFGPEFQIYSPSDAVNRANFFYQLIYSPWPIDPVLQPYVGIAGNATALINAVDNAMLLGRMSQQTRTAISNALAVSPDNNARVMTVVYLTATSGEHSVQR